MDKNYEIISGIREVHHGVHRNDLTIDQHLAKEWNNDIGKPMCVYKIKCVFQKIKCVGQV